MEAAAQRMNEAQIALARRAVAASGWRWLPGMRIASTKFARVVAVRDGAPCGAEEGATCDDNAAMWLDEWTTPMLPDLSDPLTAFGLIVLVRERWGDPTMIQQRYNGGWILTQPPVAGAAGLAGMLNRIVAQAPTELEALILALEVL